jgi:putative protease
MEAKSTFSPELLAPAGSMEKLKIAVRYGADAVYLSGQQFGLRAAADNFTDAELDIATRFAHEHGVKVFVTVNAFPMQQDFENLPTYFDTLNDIGVDAIIASDIAVVTLGAERLKCPVHLSTQASCLNRYSAQLWKSLGATRIVLGRELSIAEASRIKADVGVEVELFGHGAMCMSYSGQCTISNYTQGRDSNRGGCCQSCRFSYTLTDPHGTRAQSKFMSSRDLNGLAVLPAFFEHQIDSIKIEGRMRSMLYLATVMSAYRAALDEIAQTGALQNETIAHWQERLAHIPNRKYTTGSLEHPAGQDSIYPGEDRTVEETNQMIGVVVQGTEKEILLDVRSAFTPDEDLVLLHPGGQYEPLNAGDIRSLSGARLEKAKTSSIVRLQTPTRVAPATIVQRRSWC